MTRPLLFLIVGSGFEAASLAAALIEHDIEILNACAPSPDPAPPVLKLECRHHLHELPVFHRIPVRNDVAQLARATRAREHRSRKTMPKGRK